MDDTDAPEPSITIRLPFRPPTLDMQIDDLTLAVTAGGVEGAIRAFMKGAEERWGLQFSFEAEPSLSAFLRQILGSTPDPEQRSNHLRLEANGRAVTVLATFPAAGEAPGLAELLGARMGASLLDDDPADEG